MNMKDFKILSEETLYDGFFEIRKGKIRRENLNGKRVEVEREMLERGDSVAVLIYERDTEQLIFTRQFRYPTHKEDGYLMEIPAGAIAEGESPEQTAKREMLEEVGYKIEKLTRIFTFYTTPGTTSERIFLYYTEVSSKDQVEEGGGSDVEHEDIELLKIPVDKAHELLDRLNDAKSIIGLQWWLQHKHSTT